MAFFSSRGGDISIVRVGLFFGVLGLVIIVSGYVVYGFEQASYRHPLEVAPPQDATLIAQEAVSEGARRLYYQSNQSPEDIVEYYNAQLREYYSAEDFVACQRSPRAPQMFANYHAGNGVIPYQFTCAFDRSTVGGSQTTTIVIHPGVRNNATGENFEGTSRIEYTQVWEP
jgi:hypothetical protein